MAILPYVEELKDIGMFDEFEYSHFTLDGDRHALSVITVVRSGFGSVDVLEVGKAPSLGDVRHALADDLDSYFLPRQTVMTEADMR